MTSYFGNSILSDASEFSLRCIQNEHLQFKAGTWTLLFFSFVFYRLTTQQDQGSCASGHLLTPLGAAVFTGPVALHSS